jgi:hypothetical protein
VDPTIEPLENMPDGEAADTEHIPKLPTPDDAGPYSEDHITEARVA